MLGAVLLQRAQVVGIPELLAQPLEDGPVLLSGLVPDGLVEVAPQVGNDSVVVEERVVDIQQENDRRFHGAQSTSGGPRRCRCQSGAGPPPAVPARQHRAAVTTSGPTTTRCDTVILNEDDSAKVRSGERSGRTAAGNARHRVPPVDRPIRHAAAGHAGRAPVPNRGRRPNHRGGLRRRRHRRSGVPRAAPGRPERRALARARTAAAATPAIPSFASRPLTSTPTGIATSSRRPQGRDSTFSSISGADGSGPFTPRRFNSGRPAHGIGAATAPPEFDNASDAPAGSATLRPAAARGPSPAVPVRHVVTTFPPRPVSRGIDLRGPPSLPF